MPKLPEEHLRDRIAHLEKRLADKRPSLKDDDPCTPIADLTPPGTTGDPLLCCLQSRVKYLECLDNCDSDPCCAGCESVYRAAIEQCVSFP